MRPAQSPLAQMKTIVHLIPNRLSSLNLPAGLTSLAFLNLTDNQLTNIIAHALESYGARGTTKVTQLRDWKKLCR